MFVYRNRTCRSPTSFDGKTFCNATTSNSNQTLSPNSNVSTPASNDTGIKIIVLSVCLSVTLSICLSLYLSISLSAYLSICLPVFLNLCICVCLSVCLYICHLSMFTYVCLCVRMSVYVYVCLSMCTYVCLCVYMQKHPIQTKLHLQTQMSHFHLQPSAANGTGITKTFVYLSVCLSV